MTLKTKTFYYIFTNISSTTLQEWQLLHHYFEHFVNDHENSILVHFSKHFINIITKVTLVTTLLRSFYQRQWKQWHFYYFIFQDFSPTSSKNSGRSAIRHNSPVRATAVGFPPDNYFRDRTAEKSPRSRSVGTNRKSLRRKRADQSLQVKRQ